MGIRAPVTDIRESRFAIPREEAIDIPLMENAHTSSSRAAAQ